MNTSENIFNDLLENVVIMIEARTSSRLDEMVDVTSFNKMMNEVTYEVVELMVSEKYPRDIAEFITLGALAKSFTQLKEYSLPKTIKDSLIKRIESFENTGTFSLN